MGKLRAIVAWIIVALLAALALGLVLDGLVAAGVMFVIAAALIAPLPYLGQWIVERGLKPGHRYSLPIVAVLVALITFAATVPETPEMKTAREAREMADRAAATQAQAKAKSEQIAKREREARERATGQHCLNAGGTNASFEREVIGNLRDPDSYRHDETAIHPDAQDHQHAIVLRYRAKNGFGGYNREQALGIVDDRTCEAKLLGAAPI